MSYGDSCSHPSGYEQGNTGYSGTPLWKIRQQMQAMRQPITVEQRKADGEEKLSAKGPRLLTDAAAVVDERVPRKGPSMAKHVLVRDLRKVGQVLRLPLPREGIFQDGSGLVRCALFALFDGQCMDSPSAKAVDFHCKHMPARLVANLSSIPGHLCNITFVKGALLKSFEDVQEDAGKQAIGDGCGASLALVVGDWLFTAVLGPCAAVLCQREAGSAGVGGQLPKYSQREFGTRQRAAAIPPGGAAGAAPGGGDAAAAGRGGGVPEVSSVQIDVRGQGPFFVLTSAAVAEVVPAHDMASVAVEYFMRPRAASGGIAARASARLRERTAAAPGGGAEAAAAAEVDCCAIVTYLVADEGGGSSAGTSPGTSAAALVAEPPAAKRLKIEALQSVRVRQILVRHKEAKHPLDPVKNRPVTRTKAEAEAVLRGALAELLKEGDHRGDSMWAAKCTPTIISVCRATSECKSALKGGSMCGDLGWLGKKELESLGKETEEVVRNLSIAEWSDLIPSDQGVHIMMRIA